MNLLLINSNENNSFAAVQFKNEIRIVYSAGFSETEKPGRSPDKLINCLVNLRPLYDFSLLDAVSVTTGPGSFTGIRVGLALAKGIAGGLDKPVIPVNNFDLQYERITGKQGSKKYCILIPAKYPEYYYSLIHNNSHLDTGCSAIEEILKILEENTILAGNFDRESVLKHRYFEFINLKYSQLEEWQAMLGLSKKYFAEGRAVNPADVEPVYIKEFQPRI